MPQRVDGPDLRWTVAADRARARWADHLAHLVRAEIDGAQRAGVISAGEGEQLLARLSLVVDQALTAAP